VGFLHEYAEIPDYPASLCSLQGINNPALQGEVVDSMIYARSATNF
jgi:hypothetical protein